MSESGSNAPKETPGQEPKRLRKESSKLKSKLKSRKEADKAKIKDLKKELKKNVPMVTVTEEQRKSLSSLFPDIDSLFSQSCFACCYMHGPDVDCEP